MKKATNVKIRAKMAQFLVFTMILSPLNTWANPQDGNVAGGKATIVQTSPTRLDVVQTTDRAIINWQKFNIGAGEHTNFQQPSPSSIILNRVLGADPSSILGKLTANGRVVLVNPNGIFFGKDARVDVAALIASTHDIRNDDFMAGKLNFTIPGKPGARIINQGTITVKDGGLVALVAPSMVNSGVIAARLGKVVFAAGNAATIDLYGDDLILFEASRKITEQIKDATGVPLSSLIDNSGNILADGGWVLLTADAAKGVVDKAINMTGIIQAQTVDTQNGQILLNGGEGNVDVAGNLDASGKDNEETGGRVIVTGARIELKGSVKLDVAGDSGGGTILVGGDHLGGKLTTAQSHIMGLYMEKTPIPTAADVLIGPYATLDASAIQRGNGGKIVVWADNSTEFYGTALSRGGAFGGDGGTVEISGDRRVVALGTVDVSAPNGKRGRYLIDPLGSLYASTADYFSEYDTPTTTQIYEMHTDADGALYVLSAKKASTNAFRVDPDGTKSYLANIIITKIVNKVIVAQSVVDTIYGGDSGNGGSTPIRGALQVADNSIRVFFSEKTNGSGYAQEGYLYSLNKNTLDPLAARQTLFTTANWGWGPYFDGSGNLHHFSFAGYFSMTGTTQGAFILPDNFWKQTFAARLANAAQNGDPNTLTFATCAQLILNKAKDVVEAQANQGIDPSGQPSVDFCIAHPNLCNTVPQQQQQSQIHNEPPPNFIFAPPPTNIFPNLTKKQMDAIKKIEILPEFSRYLGAEGIIISKLTPRERMRLHELLNDNGIVDQSISSPSIDQKWRRNIDEINEKWEPVLQKAYNRFENAKNRGRIETGISLCINTLGVCADIATVGAGSSLTAAVRASKKSQSTFDKMSKAFSAFAKASADIKKRLPGGQFKINKWFNDSGSGKEMKILASPAFEILFYVIQTGAALSDSDIKKIQSDPDLWNSLKDGGVLLADLKTGKSSNIANWTSKLLAAATVSAFTCAMQDNSLTDLAIEIGKSAAEFIPVAGGIVASYNDLEKAKKDLNLKNDEIYIDYVDLLAEKKWRINETIKQWDVEKLQALFDQANK